MTPIRSFIAIELSNEARAALTQLQNRLKANVPPRSVRWTDTPNIHLTLHFLGDISPEDVKKVEQILKSSTSAQPPLSLSLGNLGCFPNTQRPRIVWVGVQGETTQLVTLHHDLGEKLKASLGFKPETRPYAPHLTLGRVKKGIPTRHVTQLGQVIEREQSKVGPLAMLQVKEIALIKSDLKPTGPSYTSLARGVFSQTRD